MPTFHQSAGFTYSKHGLMRRDSRRIRHCGVEAALLWGREIWSHGDLFYRLDRRSVKQARRHGQEIRRHEGVTVVVTQGGTIKTVYRNRLPHRRRR